MRIGTDYSITTAWIFECVRVNRHGGEADAEELHRIHRASMTDYLIEALGESPEEYAREQHLAWMREARAQTVTVDDQIIGSIDVAWTTDALYIVRMEMDPEF